MTKRVTKFEFDHSTGVITVEEYVRGKKCQYQTKDVWKVILLWQNLVSDFKPDGSYWLKGGSKNE